jgi:hypothetical protein
MNFRGSNGSTCGPPTRSSPRSRLSATAPRAKNCLSRSAFLELAFKLMEEAAKSWPGFRGAERIPDLLHGVVFEDGVPVTEDPPELRVFAA